MFDFADYLSAFIVGINLAGLFAGLVLSALHRKRRLS